MSDGFWTIAFAIGAAQGLFLTAVLLFRPGANRLATRLLATMVAVLTAMIVGGVLVQLLDPPSGQLVLFLNTNAELALGPLLLLFARALVDPAWRLAGRDAWRFLPLLLGAIIWGSAWIALGDVDRRTAFLDQHPATLLWVLFKAGWFFGHCAATYRVLRYDPRVARVHVVGRRSVELSWLRRWLLLLGGMAGLIYLSDLAGRLGLEPPVESDPFGGLVLAVMIYLASLMVLQRPWVLALRLRPAAAGRWRGESARLTAYLEQQRPWIEPELGLGDLARALGSTDNRLSTVIHEGLGTSFYALLNQYRLTEFERLVRDPTLRHSSVLDLAFEAGFNSKASFYRVFRQAHGTTPTVFREKL